MTVELIATPLNAMLDLVREIAKGAHRDRFFWRILRVAIALCLVGNNHLRVGLGAERARLKQRLFVPEAAGVNVKAGFDIVNRVYNKV